MLYRRLLRPVLFALPPETAHAVAVGGLRFIQRLPFITHVLRWLLLPRSVELRTSALGLRFATPVGLAAGFDKNAHAFEALGALGFGFVEVGTLTAEPQSGNPAPRLFRLPADRAIINRMGFNNRGAAAAADQIRKVRRRTTVLGVNIGKTKRISNEQAIEDYVRSAEMLAAHADYLVINVSSPNTPGLRDLQEIESLRPLVTRVRQALDRTCPSPRVPLLLKIAPDLADDDVDALADLALELRLDGLIATNTTTARGGLSSAAAEVAACGEGGLSGAPLKASALRVLRRLRARVGARVTLIASGGIESADDAWERICAGASLVQIYTGLTYEGPLLARRIAVGLARRAQRAGFPSVSAAVGNDLRLTHQAPEMPETEV